MAETEWTEKIEVKSGSIVIKKAMTNIGEKAVTIRNLDGEDEFIMLSEYDWNCLMDAIEKMKFKNGGSKRVKVIFDVELLTADQDALTRVCDELTTVMWIILEMQHFPIVDAVDDIVFKIEETKE